MSVTREFLQPTEETPIKPSLSIVMNAKENENLRNLRSCFFEYLLLYTLVNIPP